jgi:DNA repair exonuclease SbcCD nuclease subunit
MSEVQLENVCEKVFGITARHYRRLASQGHVPSTTRGKISFLEASRDLIAYYRKLGEKKGTSLESEKILKLAVERQLKELKLSIRSGDLIPKSDLPTLIAERRKAVKRGLDFLYRSLQKKLTGKDSRQMGEIIKAEVQRFLEKMSKQKAESGESRKLKSTKGEKNGGRQKVDGVGSTG